MSATKEGGVFENAKIGYQKGVGGVWTIVKYGKKWFNEGKKLVLN